MLALFTTLLAFDLQFAQNWGEEVKAGSTITFDLTTTAGKPAPTATTESFDVLLMDGTVDMNNPKVVGSPLATGLTSTKGNSLSIPADLPEQKYFLKIVAKSGVKLSGEFLISGGTGTKEADTKAADSTETQETADNKKGSEATSSASQLMGIIVTATAINFS